MVYVISDLHGYPLDKFIKLLESADFGSNDFLYILGDVIDRNGDGGAKMLYWLTQQPNIQLLLGNHEAMLLSCDFIFEDISGNTITTATTTENKELLNNYILNGGDVTLQGLKELSQEQRIDILAYLRDCPLYEALTVNSKDFLLVHAGLDNFSPDRKITDYTPDDLLWAWPELEDEYYPDIITVFGHTPTMSYDKKYKGKIIKTRTWIDIDVGAAYGEKPVLLRLDDFKEFRL